MGAVVKLFKWILLLLSVLAKPISLLLLTGGTIWMGVRIIGESVSNRLSMLMPQYDGLVRLSKDYLTEFMRSLESAPYWAFFYDTLAIDTLAQALVYFLGLFGGILFLGSCGILLTMLGAITAFLVNKVLRSAIQSLSAGILKL